MKSTGPELSALFNIGIAREGSNSPFSAAQVATLIFPLDLLYSIQPVSISRPTSLLGE